MTSMGGYFTGNVAHSGHHCFEISLTCLFQNSAAVLLVNLTIDSSEKQCHFDRVAFATSTYLGVRGLSSIPQRFVSKKSLLIELFSQREEVHWNP